MGCFDSFHWPDARTRTHACTHTRTHARTHARARMHARMHAPGLGSIIIVIRNCVINYNYNVIVIVIVIEYFILA